MDMIPDKDEVITALEEIIREKQNEIEHLRAALEKVVVAGNHLVDVIGVRHPAADMTYDYALMYYGPGNKYDVWCCWNTIMEARAVLEDK